MQFSNDELYTMNTLLGNRNTILNVEFIDGESHIKNGIKSLEDRKLYNSLNVIGKNRISGKLVSSLNSLDKYNKASKYLSIENITIAICDNDQYIVLTNKGDKYELSSCSENTIKMVIDWQLPKKVKEQYKDVIEINVLPHELLEIYDNPVTRMALYQDNDKENMLLVYYDGHILNFDENFIRCEMLSYSYLRTKLSRFLEMRLFDYKQKEG